MNAVARSVARRWLRLLVPHTPVSAPPSRRRSARAAVLAAAGAVVLAQVGLGVAVETSRPEWRDPVYYHRQKRLLKVVKWEREQGHARPAVVVLGGSRPLMGLSPEHLGLGAGPTDPVVFDLCQPGVVPTGLGLNLARLLAAGPAPEFVLLEVLPPVLADPGPPEARVPAVRLGLADLRRMAPYCADPTVLHKHWVANRTAPWHALRVPLLANWGLADAAPPGPEREDFLWTDMKFFGWSPFYPREWPAARRAAGLASAGRVYRGLLADFRVAPVNDRLYRDMLAACRDRGVRAALFAMPESGAFRGFYPPAARAAVAAYLGLLGREFGVPVFDASAWVDDEESYTDGHHLLGPAAEAFSRRFGRECVGPWVRGTPAAR